MHKDVAFHPRIGAVQIEDVIIRPGKYIVDHMQDRPRAVAARKIHAVVVTHRFAPEITEENAVPAGLDPASAVHGFKPCRGGRENAVLHYKRRTIQGNVLAPSVAEGKMMQEQRAIRSVD